MIAGKADCGFAICTIRVLLTTDHTGAVFGHFIFWDLRKLIEELVSHPMVRGNLSLLL